MAEESTFFDCGLFNDSKRKHRQTNNSLLPSLLPSAAGATSSTKKKRSEGILSKVNKSLTDRNEIIIISPGGEEKVSNTPMKPIPLPNHSSTASTTSPSDPEVQRAILASLEMEGEMLYKRIVAASMTKGSNDYSEARLKHLLNNRGVATEFCTGCYQIGMAGIDTVCSNYDSLFSGNI